MNAQEKKNAIEILTGSAELLNRDMSPLAISIYIRAIEDLPFEDVSKAFSQLIQEKKFFPAPAELREMVLGTPEKLEDIAMIECAKVVEAISRHGAYRSVVFDDPVTMAVIQQGFGGWERLNTDLTMSEEKFFRKDFVKTYQSYARGGITHYGVLYGITDRANSARGFEGQGRSPALIGDERKAIAVMNFKDRPQLPKGGTVAKLFELAGGVGGYEN
jgi:hypothetical protein